MPTYDYECDGCGHKFELFQPMTASPQRKCPACHTRKLRRLFGTGAAIVFKGSGFYQTDYRSESYRKDAAEAKKSTSNGSGDKSKKSDKSSSSDSTAQSSKSD
jgi:putative FmdB family regulatory protein